jgi:hypothetical protein
MTAPAGSCSMRARAASIWRFISSTWARCSGVRSSSEGPSSSPGPPGPPGAPVAGGVVGASLVAGSTRCSPEGVQRLKVSPENGCGFTTGCRRSTARWYPTPRQLHRKRGPLTKSSSHPATPTRVRPGRTDAEGPCSASPHHCGCRLPGVRIVAFWAAFAFEFPLITAYGGVCASMRSERR